MSIISFHTIIIYIPHIISSAAFIPPSSLYNILLTFFSSEMITLNPLLIFLCVLSCFFSPTSQKFRILALVFKVLYHFPSVILFLFPFCFRNITNPSPIFKFVSNTFHFLIKFIIRYIKHHNYGMEYANEAVWCKNSKVVLVICILYIIEYLHPAQIRDFWNHDKGWSELY